MTKFKYNEAIERLEKISFELESDLDDMSKLSDLVKESADLIKKCKKELRTTSDEIEKTFDGLDEK